jgi:pSer/pThr/pTyr-binding forkhead associated (FHA) protein
MDSSENSELTTTLRLGGIDPNQVEISPLLSELLESVSQTDKATVDHILQGSSDKAMLVIHKGPAKGSRYLISAQGCTIGRSHESDVFLDDVTVSRKHAAIEFLAKESRFRIVDSSSLNGTYVNSENVEHHVLSSGDQVQVGKFHLVFITGQTRSIGEK